MNLWVRIVLAVLATWRVTHLLANEDGPADIVVRFRALLGESLAGKLMDCFKCLSLWIAAPMALFVTHQLLDWLLAWLALSGGACLLERLGGEHETIGPLSQPLEGETYHVLRTETSGDAECLPEAHDTNTGRHESEPHPDTAEPGASWAAKPDADLTGEYAERGGTAATAVHRRGELDRIGHWLT